MGQYQWRIVAMLAGGLVTAVALMGAGEPTHDGIVPPPVGANGWVEIYTPGQLQYIDQHATEEIQQGSGTDYLGANIELMKNVLLPAPSGGLTANWTPFGEAMPFSGTFNGNGHEISNVVVRDKADTFVGFFGETTGTIENVGVAGSITSTLTPTASGGVGGTVGGLVGWAQSGIISHTQASVDISAETYSTNGGLVGQLGTVADSHAAIEDSHAAGSVTAPGSSTNGGLVGAVVGGTVTSSYAGGTVSGGAIGSNGGLVGWENGGRIDQTYSDASVFGASPTEDGGLVGTADGAVRNSYALGSVTGLTDSAVGGLIGVETRGSAISNCYAVGAVGGDGTSVASGGLIGTFQSFTTPAPTVSGSYFDPKTTGQTTGVGQGVELLPDIFSESTLAMQTQDTYVNWNFSTVWAIDSASNNGLPYLQAIKPMPPTGDMPEVPWAAGLPLVTTAIALGYAWKRRYGSSQGR